MRLDPVVTNQKYQDLCDFSQQLGLRFKILNSNSLYDAVAIECPLQPHSRFIARQSMTFGFMKCPDCWCLLVNGYHAYKIGQTSDIRFVLQSLLGFVPQWPRNWLVPTGLATSLNLEKIEDRSEFDASTRNSFKASWRSAGWLPVEDSQDYNKLSQFWMNLFHGKIKFNDEVFGWEPYGDQWNNGSSVLMFEESMIADIQTNITSFDFEDFFDSRHLMTCFRFYPKHSTSHRKPYLEYWPMPIILEYSPAYFLSDNRQSGYFSRKNNMYIIGRDFNERFQGYSQELFRPTQKRYDDPIETEEDDVIECIS